MKINLSQIKNSKELLIKPFIKPRNNWEDLFKASIKLSDKKSKKVDPKNISNKFDKEEWS
ncbi:MAG TPA: hypothetical protein VK787_12550 [Puia sp.]|jgi:hypothetical protein|nr:hypothetical protein [Puia sp.]